MKILVPTSWNDVTVEEYQQLASLDADDNASKRLADIISILCGVNSLELTTDTVKEIQESIAFLNENLPKDRYSSFIHDGIEYEWIKSINEITLGEQISIEQTIENEELNYSQSFDLVMAVLLVKKGEKFNAKDLNKNRELYSKFPITKVHEMILFFLSGGKISLQPIREFLVIPKMSKIEKIGLMKRERLMKRLKRKVLVVVLSGLQWLTGWLKMILRSMK